jgi:uncharacterized repeat protein (TIGR03803 family)
MHRWGILIRGYIVRRYVAVIKPAAEHVALRSKCSIRLAGFYVETNPLCILISWAYKIEVANSSPFTTQRPRCGTELYGSTSAGGSYGSGTVFQLKRSKSGWTENILYNFQGGNDGNVPYAGVILDHSGNLYGGATGGGTGGGGTIFELTPSSGGWTFSVLYNLAGSPVSGPFRNLKMDASGNLYGTTHCDGAYSDGTVYKLTPSGGTWTYTSLYVFTGGADGYYSFSNLVFDKQGNLYGTTIYGGTNVYGVAFKITP